MIDDFLMPDARLMVDDFLMLDAFLITEVFLMPDDLTIDPVDAALRTLASPLKLASLSRLFTASACF